MATLCPGVQYGLSSQQNFGENKDLIFVKLTDSALRAIDEFVKNQNKFNCQGPTIKFLGNEGQLSFPSIQNGHTSFSFTMSSTADMEGPGGSFECVQQTGLPRGSLEVLGSIPYKVRVRANDDVYEATRHRMTIAEENHKNKCTREIKPNEKDIGRKVKLKQNRTPLPPIRREPPSQRDSLPKPSYQSNVPSKTAAAVISSSNGLLSNGLGSNHVSSSRPQLNKPSVPDIARRPIKERLIHLLALRPFKKVELHDRITKEGVREKNGITSILKQISFMKDNCYHLNRAVWNEVNEDWPFYTESERQALKRRKPQNLTPPGSSDGGSSGSGQSPTSTHPGSPPPISTSTSSSKRPGYYDNQDGLPTKRQRISHYRKPSEQQTYRSPAENNSQRRPVTDSRDASNMNPRSRESPTTMNGGYLTPITNGGYANGTTEKRNFSDDGDDIGRKRSCDSHSLSYVVGRDKTISAGDARNSPQTNKTTENGYVNGMVPNGKCKGETREKDRNKYERVTSSSQNRSVRVSPDSQSEAIGNNDSGVSLNSMSPKHITTVDSSSEFPDYLTEYTTIKDAEQRRRFKADFNADYAEYKDLHGIVEKVSRRFVDLELKLKKEDASSPRFKDLKKQIVKEYNENKKDLEHQKLKRRFQYLHDKLSHIKRLVLEYDQGLANNQY
ncbi:RNA polymerase II elongation factor Ell [Tenebrio molitor]|uniref:RNA polymerase II elongation factor Ell n=1 Tax=Tenebrio molitor TaxID=7067 RepID=UPI0036247BDC